MLAHPTAVIAAGAEIADDVEIGSYAVIEDGVKIGRGCRLAGHVQIVNSVEIGRELRNWARGDHRREPAGQGVRSGDGERGGDRGRQYHPRACDGAPGEPRGECYADRGGELF